jgi:hypothetical protein
MLNVMYPGNDPAPPFHGPSSRSGELAFAANFHSGPAIGVQFAICNSAFRLVPPIPGESKSMPPMRVTFPTRPGLTPQTMHFDRLIA